MGLGDAMTGLGEFYGSLIGDWATHGERERKRKAIEEERALYGGLPVDLVAGEETLTELGPSAYADLAIDPATRLSQLDALRRIEAIGAAGGADPQFRALQAQAQAGAEQQARAAQSSVLNDYARRGMAGSPAALVAALTGSQGAIQRGGMAGLQGAADQAARGYQSLADSGALAGNIRGMDAQQAGARADALDRVSQWNAQNRQSVAARNNATRNQFAMGNADRAYRRAGMLGGTYDTERGYLSDEERRKRGLATGIGGGIGRNIGTGADLVFGGR